jgi:hypothetical protein
MNKNQDANLERRWCKKDTLLKDNLGFIVDFNKYVSGQFSCPVQFSQTISDRVIDSLITPKRNWNGLFLKA